MSLKTFEKALWKISRGKHIPCGNIEKQNIPNAALKIINLELSSDNLICENTLLESKMLNMLAQEFPKQFPRK